MKQILVPLLFILLTVSVTIGQNQQWEGVKRFGSSVNMKKDQFGNYYLLGKIEVTKFCGDYLLPGQYYYDTLKVERLCDEGYYEYYMLLKLNKDFKLIWKKRIWGAGPLEKYSVSNRGDVGVCFVGTRSNVYVDTNKVLESTISKFSLLRFSPDGKPIWSGAIKGKSTFTKVADIRFDNRHNMYLTGPADGDFIYIYDKDGNVLIRQKTDHYLSDVNANSYIVKQNASLHFDYIKFITATSGSFGINSIDFDPENNIYLVGTWSGDGKVENIEKIPLRNEDGFIMKFTKDFKLLWSKQIGSVNNTGYEPEGFTYVKYDSLSNSLYVTGLMQRVVEIDSQFYPVNDKNICLLKFCPNGNFNWIAFDGHRTYDPPFSEKGKYIYIGKHGYVYVLGSTRDVIKHSPVDGGKRGWYHRFDFTPMGISSSDKNFIYLSGQAYSTSKFGNYWLLEDLTYTAYHLGFIAKFADTSTMIDQNKLKSPCSPVTSTSSNKINTAPFLIINNYNTLIIKNKGNKMYHTHVNIFNLAGQNVYSNTFTREIKIKHTNIGVRGFYIIQLSDNSYNEVFTSKLSIHY